MKFVLYAIAVVLGLLGLLFLVAAGQGNAIVRIAIAVVCLAAAVALVVAPRLRPTRETHVHEMKLDLTGDVSLENMTCRQCGATLSSKSVNVAAGAVFVHCEFCDAQYQMEEVPKW